MIVDKDKEKSDLLLKDIVKTKFKLEDEGKNPRVVLLSKEENELLKNNWIKTYKELPWADSINFELIRNKNKESIFLGDGTILGLWVVVVDTIEEFKVY